MYLHNREDVEDVFQEVFLKLLQTNIVFKSEEHEKAWLCRVTINKCKDLAKVLRKNVDSIEDREIPLLTGRKGMYCKRSYPCRKV